MCSDNADDDVRSSSDAFLSNEEMQLTHPRLAEACKQTLLGNRVLNEVDVPIEMEPKWSARICPMATMAAKGPHLGSVKFLVRLAAQVFRRDSVRRLKNALENDAFGWNDSRHVRIIVLHADRLRRLSA